MERLAPAVFVEIGSKVVVAANIKLAFGPARKPGAVQDMVHNGREKQRQELDHLLSSQGGVLGLTGLTAVSVPVMER